MIEPLLKQAEATAIELLQGIYPDVTRRTALFLPDGVGQRALDVFAKVQEQRGSPVSGEATRIQFQLTAAARESSPRLAADFARFLADSARVTLLTSRREPFNSHEQTSYEEVPETGKGAAIYQIRVVMILRITHRAGSVNTLGLVKRITGDLSPDTDGRSIAELGNRAIVIDDAGGFITGPINAFYVNAEAGDTIELLDETDTVVDSQPAAAGAGKASFTVSNEGVYSVAINNGFERLESALTTTVVKQPTE